MQNPVDDAVCNPDISGNTSAGPSIRTQPTNQMDKFVVQFGARMRRALWYLLTAASFAHHVLAVVSFSAKEQMGRIYAGSVIAAMADAKAVRNWSVGDLPSDAVGTSSPAIITLVDLAVARGRSTAEPFPAVIDICLRNVPSKSLGEWDTMIKHYEPPFVVPRDRTFASSRSLSF